MIKTTRQALLILFVLLAQINFGKANNFFAEKHLKTAFSVKGMIKIRGKVVDKTTREPVPYANVGVTGTYIGTASNMDGEFELKIPQRYRNDSMYISAVGFENQKLSIAKKADEGIVIIELVSKNFKIDEVDIESKSLVAYKILKTAVEKLKTNYIQMPYNYDSYYRCEKKVNDRIIRLREAAVRIYDNLGYERGDSYKVFKERNYRFLQVRRSFELNSLSDGSTNLDDLLEMDVVRVRGNILNLNYINPVFYDVEIEKITEYENDSIWVISYKNKRKPSLSSTGDVYAKKYEGKIYVKKKDYAIVKNETQVEANNYSELGRSFYVQEDKLQWKRKSVKYNFTVIYRKQEGYYYLSYLNYNRSLKLQNKKDKRIKTEDIKTEMMVNKVITKKPEKIEKRAYYENIKFDKKFWNSYNFLLDVKKK